MEYYALYCQLNGKPKPGYKAMIILQGLEVPVDVFEDDRGQYYCSNGKTYRTDNIGDAQVVPIEQALCAKEIEVGDVGILRGQLTTARKIVKIENSMVYFVSGSPRIVSIDQVYKRLAAISEQVNFLPDGAKVDISSVTLFVVSSSSGHTIKSAEFSTSINPKTERLVAFVACPTCGTMK